ncbi:hypothetical protein BBJ28_00027113, partial [Nothophytophthora sp. Chile5]
VSDGSRSSKPPRTHSDRYKEAVRATHLIASELADISDEREFEQMLQFVLSQWRNARQSKRTGSATGTAAGKPVDTAGHEPVVLPPIVSPKSPRIRRASESRDLSLSTAQISKIKLERAARSSSDNSEADEDLHAEDEADEDVQEEEAQDDAAPSEYKHGVNIKLNPKARKVGRPGKKRQKTAAGERADRVWFTAAEEGRRLAGEVTLIALADSLDAEQPGLEEVQRRLGGVLVKYTSAEKKRPLLKSLKSPVLNLDAFYLLPPLLLKSCIRLLPFKNTNDNPVTLDGVEPTPTSGPMEVVQIKDVGSFSREQIETFQRVTHMKEQVSLGLDLYKWILQDALPALPAELHATAEATAAAIVSSYPFASIDGLPKVAEYCYAMLYRATPPTWLSDACIRALCARLVSNYPSARYGGLQTRLFETAKKSPKTKRSKLTGCTMAEDIAQRVAVQVEEEGVGTIMIPVNFDNAHWCCIIVKVDAQRIYCYDPLNQSEYLNAVLQYATSLKQQALSSFEVYALNTPIQFDLFSCGVFVCWAFIRYVVQGAHRDMSKGSSLIRRRFELFYFVLTGK